MAGDARERREAEIEVDLCGQVEVMAIGEARQIELRIHIVVGIARKDCRVIVAGRSVITIFGAQVDGQIAGRMSDDPSTHRPVVIDEIRFVVTERVIDQAAEMRVASRQAEQEIFASEWTRNAGRADDLVAIAVLDVAKPCEMIGR